MHLAPWGIMSVYPLLSRIESQYNSEKIIPFTPSVMLNGLLFKHYISVFPAPQNVEMESL
jgi:hypothetical protein